jgi:dTDP-4-amino-4,6-dideoxygalactose transaminase
VGINSRLDELQAAILRVKLSHLDAWTAGRRQKAARYRELFSESGLQSHVALPFEPEYSVHVYNQFVVRAANRDQLREHLWRSGIPSEIYYPSPLHLEQAYAYLGYRAGEFPNSERASAETLALPIFAELTEAQQRAVVTAISEFYF